MATTTEEKLDLVLAELREIKAQIGYNAPPEEKPKTMTAEEVAEMFTHSVRLVKRREGIFSELKPAFKHPIRFYRADVERLYRRHSERLNKPAGHAKLLKRPNTKKPI
ncbi:MAG TPA: hypothetical protein VF596_18795 [Pyrinomonadaceae bacterium]|jgi:hypothetical protein